MTAKYLSTREDTNVAAFAFAGSGICAGHLSLIYGDYRKVVKDAANTIGVFTRIG